MKRMLSWICAMAMLALSVPFAASATPALTSQTLDFAAMQGYYKTQGRVELVDTALDMDTTSSGFEFYFYGAGDVALGADVKCTYVSNMFLSVIVDGVETRVEVNNGTTGTAMYHSITLASGLSEGYHHIEVYRQTEASSALMTAWGVTFTGTLMATPPSDKITIEVVGDSISGGTGNLTTPSTANGSYPVYQDGTQTYAYLAGEALGANVRVTQTSGYGCCGGWNSQGTDLNLQDMFPYTSYWRDHTDTGYYDFKPAADIVVINLGTNDCTAADYGKISLTDEEFKAGAKNLMTMAKNSNPGAKVVWCTGMMGIYYPTMLAAAVADLGGAAEGFYYLVLPEGRSGGDGGHPSVAEHQAAADVLETFLLENCLPEDYKADFATADALQETLTAAKAVSNPKATLAEAIRLAEMDLNCGTTDEYRLGVRVAALEEAMNGTVTALDLKPVDGEYTAPQTEYNGETHSIWPSFYNADRVTLWKNGASNYWPYIHMDYMQTLNILHTPYLTLDIAATASWNIHVAYLDQNGVRCTEMVSAAAGNGTNDFAPTDRTTMTIDFGGYIQSLGHADSEGMIRIVGVDIYAVGVEGQYVNLFTCAFTDDDGSNFPQKITGNTHVVENGVVVRLAEGATADDVINGMNDAEYLRVVDADGNAVTGTVATGMILQLVNPADDTVVDEAVLSVLGDVNGDGEVKTDDCRAILFVSLDGMDGLSAAQLAAGDVNGDDKVNTSDVRQVLLAEVNAV